ncbi:very short patch repair endonuclease [Kitasatospora sp. MAA4]|uniref:very short patch repair endonuclease n=1 Tax=Kitasatospora sp. MAA4 TaxID=3035093 RepID=UPI002475199E|nr:very short patch repair endonuclease [Kitasatospora sp. MAA4]
MDVGEGRLRPASVVLKGSIRTGLITAVLRWSVDGRSTTVPLGKLDRPTRVENLREGWRLAREAGMLSKPSAPEDSWASSPATRKSMVGNKGRDTKPELRLRSLLHRAGLRYRVSARPIPSLRRTADVVFPKAKVAVFVDGCYWHGCPEHRSVPATNRDFWVEKIKDTKARDAETVRLLENSGWKVLRFWEHTPPGEAAQLVIDEVAAARKRINTVGPALPE